MALTERRIRYETLIRWHEDGSIGAHQVDLDQVLRDGVVLASTPTAPMQLGTADYKGAIPLSDILGEAASSALARVGALEQSLSDVNGIAKQQLNQLSEVRAELETAEQTIAGLQAQLGEGRTVEAALAATELTAEQSPQR